MPGISLADKSMFHLLMVIENCSATVLQTSWKSFLHFSIFELHDYVVWFHTDPSCGARHLCPSTNGRRAGFGNAHTESLPGVSCQDCH